MKYEELLQRSENGLYLHQINIQPKGQTLPDFLIKVDIDESLPLENLAVWRQKDTNEGKSEREEVTLQTLTHDQKNFPKKAFIDINSNNAQNNGRNWKFQVQYDVQRLASCIFHFQHTVFGFDIKFNLNSSVYDLKHLFCFFSYEYENV